MPEKRNKMTITRLAQGVLFTAMVLVGLFVHFSQASYNWLTLLVLLAVTIYFYLYHKSLWGAAIFFVMAFLTTMLPYIYARLGLFFIIPLAIYAVIIRLFPSIRNRSRWFYVGQIDKFTWLGGLAIAILSVLGLYLWTIIAKPDLSDLQALIPHQSLAALLIVGFGFAIVNSFVEESIYRGLLWTAFGNAFGNIIIVNLLQAAIFGIAHLQGFPRGAIGVVMAFVYGLLLGWIRRRSGGLLAPIIVHFVADMTLYFILMRMTGRI
jgi:membrane protease YdiL (CAAX protease family)